MSAPESLREALGRLSGPAKASLAALGGFAALLCWQLLPQWRHNADLAHGWFMPAIFLILLHESRTAGPQRFLRSGFVGAAAVALLAAAGLAALAAAGLYAAAIEWSNALVKSLLAVSLSCLLGAALAHLSNERTRLVPCNWSAWVAIGLWPLSAPLPPGLYSRITLGLQLWVSSSVMDVLQLLGVAAHRQGNVIELATVSVGIEEACSGVRSLVSCVFVALFLSAAAVRATWARAVVISVAAPLALAMNFIRSLTLTLLANRGVDIAGFWHDATGYAVLLVTAAMLSGFAFALDENREPQSSSDFRFPISAFRFASPAFRFSSAFLAGSLALAALLVVFFVSNTRAAAGLNAPAPDLIALLPAAPPGWTAAAVEEFPEFRGLLHTDVLVQQAYRGGPADRPVQITFYLAYWHPGQASVSEVDDHTPDACWPGSGWIPQPAFPASQRLSAGGRTLAGPESRLFANQGVPRYVWFWHLYDGRPIPFKNPYSARALLQIAWHYGFRQKGSQMFVSVSSNQPWEAISGEPLLAEFFARMRPLGL